MLSDIIFKHDNASSHTVMKTNEDSNKMFFKRDSFDEVASMFAQL